jgi:endonuclease YncB( thermonuclease family)
MICRSFLAVAALGVVVPCSLYAASSAPVAACRIVDGDTLNCDGERVRLLGIDAPELPGHCRQGRACVAGDPFASADSLSAGLVPPLSINRVGVDRYGRTLALVRGRRGDLSCWQLRQRAAIYRADWDNDGRVAALCPAMAR